MYKRQESWPAAVDGCTYVCHVASPFVFGISDKDEDTLIKPAVDGTLNVLRPCMANKVYLYTYELTSVISHCKRCRKRASVNCHNLMKNGERWES